MDANSALQQATGQAGSVDQSLQDEKSTLGPMLQQTQQTAQQPIQQPKLQQQNPEGPSPEFGRDATEWTSMLNVLAGISGIKSRQHATTALTSFSQGLDSFKQGKIEDFKVAQQQWKDANTAISENNRAQIESYKSALSDKKMSLDEQMAQIKIVASQYHNDIMSQLAEERNFTGIARVMDMMQNQTAKLNLAYQQMNGQIDDTAQQAEEMRKAGKVYQDTFFKDGKPAAQVPPFQQWYEQYEKEHGGAQGSGGAAGYSDDTLREMAGQYLDGDKTVLQSMGTGKAAMKAKAALRNKITQIAKERGMDDQDIADSLASYQGQVSANRTVGNSAVKIKLASNILDKSLPSLMDAAKKLGLSESTDINELVNFARRKLSDADYTNFSTQLRAVTSDYATMMSRGGNTVTVHSDEEALRILNENMGDTSLQGFVDAVRIEQKNLGAGVGATKITGRKDPSSLQVGVPDSGWSIKPVGQ